MVEIFINDFPKLQKGLGSSPWLELVTSVQYDVWKKIRKNACAKASTIINIAAINIIR